MVNRLGDVRLRIVWWTRDTDHGHYDYNRFSKALNKQISSTNFDEIVEDQLDFAPKEDIKEGDYLLAWRARNIGLMAKRSKPYWVYVHKIVKTGFPGEIYSDVVVQLKGEYKPTPPFDCSDIRFREALEQVINSKRFTVFRDTQGSVWRVDETRSMIPNLLRAINRHYSN